MMERRGGLRLAHLWSAFSLLRRPANIINKEPKKQQRAQNNISGKHNNTSNDHKGTTASTSSKLIIAKAGRRIFSGVKKFLGRVESHKGIETIKDFLLGGYQRLPKTSSFSNIFSSRCSSRSFYSDANWHFADDETLNKDKTSSNLSLNMELHDHVNNNADGYRFGGLENSASVNSKAFSGVIRHAQLEIKQHGSRVVGDITARVETKRKVEEKLREFAVRNNSMEDALDIEEFLHYYCRITCPSYLDIANQFIFDLLGESVDFT